MSYKDLKQPLAGDAPTTSKDEPKREGPANDPDEMKPQTDDPMGDAESNEHGSGHGHSDSDSDSEKKPV